MPSLVGSEMCIRDSIRAVEDFPLARPARVRPRFVVTSVFGYAAAGAAAAAGSALVVAIGVHVDPGPHAGIDEGCDGSGVRRVGWRVGSIQYVTNVSFPFSVPLVISGTTRLGLVLIF